MADPAGTPIENPSPPPTPVDGATQPPGSGAPITDVSEELITTAQRDSVRIVAAAKAQIHQTILRSEHELHLLAAQTQAMLDVLHARELDERGARRPPARPAEFPDSARHVLSNLMRESRAELASLSEAEPLAPTVRFELPTVVAVSAPPERQDLKGRVSRVLGANRRVIAVASAAVVLIAACTGLWWGLQRPALEDSFEDRPVATGGGTAQVEVDLEVRRPVWIRVGVDGRSGVGRLFHTGEKQRITAAQEVSIRAGDAGAVFLSINGGAAAALGRDGQVLTRRVRPSEKPQAASSTGRTESDSRRAGETSRAVAPTGKTPRDTPSPTDVESPAPAPTPTRESLSTDAPGVVTGNAPAAVRSELIAAAQRWLEAYAAGARARMAAMSSPDLTITDQRAGNERLAPGLTGVQRILDEASVQVFGSDALLTAKLIERGIREEARAKAESIAFVSLMWTRRTGDWKLTQVRIVSAAALEKMAHEKRVSSLP